MKKSNDTPNDFAGSPLPLRAPVSWWAVGRSRLIQDREGSVTYESLPPLEYFGNPGVSFSPSSDPENAAIDDLLAGVPPEDRLRWMHKVYDVMRQRNLWPVNLPLEQFIASEMVALYFPDQAAIAPATLQ